MNLRTMLAAAALAAAAGLSHDATAAQTYEYEFLPGKGAISYIDFSTPTPREIYAGLAGRVKFVVNDDNTIASKSFDLTLQGPFYDSSHAEVDWAPFAPGDKLADFLAVDFANAGGLAIPSSPAPQAFVGPDVSGDAQSVNAGSSYYSIWSLGALESILSLEALARPDLGGAFHVFPPSLPTQTSPGGFWSGPLQLGPNVARVPEPAAATLLLLGMPFMVRCLRRGR